MRNRDTWLLTVLTILTLLSAHTSAQPVPVNPLDEKVSLAAHTFYFEDVNGEFDITQVTRSEFRPNFTRNNTSQLHFGLTTSVYWLRVALDWQSPSTRKWILEVGPPKHVEGIARGGVDIYLFDRNGQQLLSERLGSYSASEELRTLSGGYAISLDPTTVAEIFLRVETAREFRLPLSLWSEGSFRTQEINTNTLFGVQYGILLAMLCYNLFLYFSIRERSFLFFVIAAGTQLAFLFLDSKHARLVNESEWISFWAINMLERNIYIFMAIALLQFQRHLLQVWTYNRVLDNLLLTLIALFAAVLLASLIPDEKFVQTLFLPLLIITVGLGFYTNLDAIRREMEAAVVHLLAIGVLAAASAVQLAHQVFDLLPDHWLTEQAFELGIVAHAMLLSLSLAYRYNAMKKEKEKAQQLSIAHLIKSEKFKDDLLANVSHELRTPVHGITGLAEVAIRDLQQEKIDRTAVIENLRLIGNSGDRLVRLINDLLDLSQIKHLSIKLNLVPIDLYTLSDMVLRSIGAPKNSTVLQIHNDVPRDIPPVLADKDRLQQILLNLISNAIKFTSKGDVWVSASISDPGFATVSIRDTGVGISAEDQSRIFDTFVKANTPLESPPEGTGLGLAICKNLVEMHGSILTVQSILGAGSVFQFRLPFIDEKPVPATELETPPNTGSNEANDLKVQRAEASGQILNNNALILIVDDDAINRKVMRGHLSQYQLVEATDGSHAIETVSRRKPDLILLDLMMPGMNGYEVCRQLRKQYDKIQLPIIIVTARNHLENSSEGVQAGANEFLSKPFSMEELRRLVQSQLKIVESKLVKSDNTF